MGFVNLEKKQLLSSSEQQQQDHEQQQQQKQQVHDAKLMGTGYLIKRKDDHQELLASSEQHEDQNHRNKEQHQQQQKLKQTSKKQEDDDDDEADDDQEKPFEAEPVWTNIILFIILHSMIPIAIYQALNYELRPSGKLVVWTIGLAYFSGLGVTAGTHRLWSHKAYKASWPMEVFLMFWQTMAGQNSAYIWSRDHRVHHKYSETNADPHNIKRGFFFAHMGWLCCRKHPDVKAKGKLIDMSDLEANPIVMFQLRHFWWLATLCTFVIPVLTPVYLWNERLATSLVYGFGIRYLLLLHFTWLVNSAAHYYGSRPYDTGIEARESPVVILSGLGEGFHNYHHTFPFDYSTSEHGRYLNFTTAFIDLCAYFGLASDRRKVDTSTIQKRQMRTGIHSTRLASLQEAH